VVPILSRRGLVRFKGVGSDVQGELGRLFLWDWEKFEVFSEDLGEAAFHKIIEFVYICMYFMIR
jgi:hypothetical protein